VLCLSDKSLLTVLHMSLAPSAIVPLQSGIPLEKLQTRTVLQHARQKIGHDLMLSHAAASDMDIVLMKSRPFPNCSTWIISHYLSKSLTINCIYSSHYYQKRLTLKYNLRSSAHNRQLTRKTEHINNSPFIIRMLYKDSYWL